MDSKKLDAQYFTDNASKWRGITVWLSKIIDNIRKYNVTMSYEHNDSQITQHHETKETSLKLTGQNQSKTIIKEWCVCVQYLNLLGKKVNTTWNVLLENNLSLVTKLQDLVRHNALEVLSTKATRKKKHTIMCLHREMTWNNKK